MSAANLDGPPDLGALNELPRSRMIVRRKKTNRMKKITHSTVIIASLLLPLAARAQQARNLGKVAKKTSAIQHGQYLVRLGGCNDCHTPVVFNKDLNMPVPDMTRMLSGHPADAPDPTGTPGERDACLIGPTFTSFKMAFGVVYSANLTPDLETGLGSWTEAMFVTAMRTGKHFGGNGRAILPPMPWMNVAALTDQDLKAIFSYLRSIPAIRNPVPDDKVSREAIEGITESIETLKAVYRQHDGAVHRDR